MQNKFKAIIGCRINIRRNCLAAMTAIKKADFGTKMAALPFFPPPLPRIQNIPIFADYLKKDLIF